MKKGELAALLMQGQEEMEAERFQQRQAYIAEMKAIRENQLSEVWESWMKENAERCFTLEGLQTGEREAFYLDHQGKMVLAFIPRKKDGQWINEGFQVQTTDAPVCYLERLTREEFATIASTHTIKTGQYKALRWAEERFSPRSEAGLELSALLK